MWIHDDVNNNPNSITTNLASAELNKDEILKDVYDQILKQNILKDDHVYRPEN